MEKWDQRTIAIVWLFHHDRRSQLEPVARWMRPVLPLAIIFLSEEKAKAWLMISLCRNRLEQRAVPIQKRNH